MSCLEDRYGRRIDYMRVSVTDRCNLRCVYCLPEGGVELKPHAEILSYEEIALILREAASLGVSRVRLTGGEPLVRRGLVPFAARIARIPGIREVSLTTNGVLLREYAEALLWAGVQRLNVSLDSLRPDRFRALTRGGDLSRVWSGIRRALELGFDPVKLNVVLMRGVNDDEVPDFARLAVTLPLHVRFIELMPLGEAKGQSSRLVTAEEVLGRVGAEWPLVPADGVAGGGPARYFRLGDSPGTVGVIAPLSRHFCDRCNRLRLEADGRLSPCLADGAGVEVRRAARAEVRRVLAEAVMAKPARHSMDAAAAGGSSGGGADCGRRYMSRLGG